MGVNEPEPPPLSRQASFRKWWTGQSISVFGDQITILALPLTAILTLDASAGQMGLLAAAGWAPHLLLSLQVGLWVDARAKRRQIMIAADLARAVVLLSIPVAYAFDTLTIWQLYTVAFLAGAGSVFFDLCVGSLFARIVPRRDVVEAQSKFMVSRSAAYIAGPSVAGFLVQLLRAPVAIVVDAVSFLASAAFLSRIRAPDAQPETRGDSRLLRRLGEGAVFIFRHPTLRAGVGCTSTINFFNLMFYAIFVLYMSDELGLSPGTIGVILATGAVGALVGALVASRVGRRIGIGPAFVVGAILFPVPLLLVPLAGGPTWLVVAMLVTAEFAASLGVMIFDISQNSLTLVLVPDRVRARVAGASRFFNYGVRPLGALAAGALGTLIGLRPTLWVATGGALLGVLFLAFSPVPSIRELPEQAT